MSLANLGFIANRDVNGQLKDISALRSNLLFKQDGALAEQGNKWQMYVLHD